MKCKKIVISTLLATSVTMALFADTVVSGDQIVDGSQCIGQDCVNNEAFSFTTLKLKENNLRIEFRDTSNSASFPSTDWQITINDSTNGGENYFAVENLDAGKTPLKIDNDGAVSLGNNNQFELASTGDLTITGTLSDSSDVNLKENFTNIKTSEVLTKIENLPITTWNYKQRDIKDRHIGAMAQDFYKSFEFGADNLHISPRDVAFVSMAGVQELVQLNRQKDNKIKELEKRVKQLESLEKSIKNLESLVGVLLNPKKETPVAIAK